MDDFDKFRQALLRDKQPLTLEQLAAFWLRRNKDAIIKCAYAILSEPACQDFRILPLTFVAFENEHAKLRYQLALHEAAERAVREQKLPSGYQRNTAIAHARIRLHVHQFTAFLKQRLMERFTSKIDEAPLYHSLAKEEEG